MGRLSGRLAITISISRAGVSFDADLRSGSTSISLRQIVNIEGRESRRRIIATSFAGNPLASPDRREFAVPSVLIRLVASSFGEECNLGNGMISEYDDVVNPKFEMRMTFAIQLG
jgi:hypothetical protein